jgi:hypothetical protein
MIGTTLQGAGHDWHDIAGALIDSIAPSQPKPHLPPRNARDSDSVSWREQRDFCLQHEYLLRGRELQFVTSLNSWHGSLTDKQASWLSAIYRRLRRAT